MGMGSGRESAGSVQLVRIARNAQSDSKFTLKSLSAVIMPPKQKYADGEKVLCYHGPLLYEAKVRETKAVCCTSFVCPGIWVFVPVYYLCVILSIPLVLGT